MEKNSNKVLCSKCIVNEDSKEPEDQVSNVTIQRTPVTGDGPKCLSKLSDASLSEYHDSIDNVLKGINLEKFYLPLKKVTSVFN